MIALWNCCSECTPTESYLSNCFPVHPETVTTIPFQSLSVCWLEIGHGEVAFGVDMTFRVSGG